MTSAAQHLINAGIEQGIEQGIEKGIEQGVRKTLARQLGARFGALTPAAEARLAQAALDELERWTDRVLIAQRIEDVFDDR